MRGGKQKGRNKKMKQSIVMIVALLMRCVADDV